ncbi:hypothetical protein [Nonomuraea typhae]|uniref:Uncharacterized protein n=1 Tax=Nonomuraea typhae TaxID=2603600 RepID=A0ABW7ZFW1_9ACTN
MTAQKKPRHDVVGAKQPTNSQIGPEDLAPMKLVYVEGNPVPYLAAGQGPVILAELLLRDFEGKPIARFIAEPLPVGIEKSLPTEPQPPLTHPLVLALHNPVSGPPSGGYCVYRKEEPSGAWQKRTV